MENYICILKHRLQLIFTYPGVMNLFLEYSTRITLNPVWINANLLNERKNLIMVCGPIPN